MGKEHKEPRQISEPLICSFVLNSKPAMEEIKRMTNLTFEAHKQWLEETEKANMVRLPDGNQMRVLGGSRDAREIAKYVNGEVMSEDQKNKNFGLE